MVIKIVLNFYADKICLLKMLIPYSLFLYKPNLSNPHSSTRYLTMQYIELNDPKQ